MQANESKHPITRPPLDEETKEVMWSLFIQIGKFWGNAGGRSENKPDLYSFMEDRIDFDPMYHDYYVAAREVIKQLVTKHGESEGYKYLFTNIDALRSPPETPLDLTRQKVSNEFVLFQLALGGFKDFGAKNYCGYIGGPNTSGNPAPYRTMEVDDAG